MSAMPHDQSSGVPADKKPRAKRRQSNLRLPLSKWPLASLLDFHRGLVPITELAWDLERLRSDFETEIDRRSAK